jgi:peptide/nickel transport system permease protein
LSRRWLVRRIGVAIVVLFVALLINFILPRLMPGDAADIYATAGRMTEQERMAIVQRFGLDQPLWTQFTKYIVNSFQGNFGYSFTYYPSTVMSKVVQALPWSLFLIINAMILQVIIAFILGATSAWKAGGKFDATTQALSLALWATPMFWLAMLALYFFGAQLHWFPIGGQATAAANYSSFFERIGDYYYHATLPIAVLVINQFGGYQLIMRNTMVTTIKEHYITTAEAKGVSERAVKYRHAARNAMLPMVTSVGLRFSLAVAGSIFTEMIFNYNGIGRLIFQSVQMRDYPVLQGCFFILSCSVIIANLLVDILYHRLDPRIRH